MKSFKIFALALVWLLMLTACSTAKTEAKQNLTSAKEEEAVTEVVEIELSDNEIKVDGEPAETNTENMVYLGNDIVYYEEGKDHTYGEGTAEDAHSADDAAQHTVVHITKPGAYRISGTLTKGQIAVDLGDEAKRDPEAVVTLILNGTDITCQVAPAMIFYNVYECGSADVEQAVKDVDTSSAGANVIIADGTTNTINGSYVARIYEPDSVVLNEDGTEVEDAEKLHKYDAALYSRMSMNVNGESENNGILTIHADNEGLDSELHLTINGGNISIVSGNDGINTNEDEVSVTTINGGMLHIRVTGETGEGDGIDSNGWLVINGGTVVAQACSFSGDAGIDSDMGIHINGGTVIASGNMLDQISESRQTYAVMNFTKFLGAGIYRVKNADNEVILEQEIENSFTSLIISSAELAEGDYTLWYQDTQLTGTTGGGRGMQPNPGVKPEGMTPPEMPEGFEPEKGTHEREEMMPPAGFKDTMELERNEDGTITLPDGSVVDPSEFEGKGPGGFGGTVPDEAKELSEIFTIRAGANHFNMIGVKE